MLCGARGASTIPGKYPKLAAVACKEYNRFVVPRFAHSQILSLAMHSLLSFPCFRETVCVEECCSPTPPLLRGTGASVITVIHIIAGTGIFGCVNTMAEKEVQVTHKRGHQPLKCVLLHVRLEKEH